MVEDLRFALINLDKDGDFSHFEECSNGLIAVYRNIVISGMENEICVYFDSNEMGVLEESKYLDKQNTLKSFSDIYLALNYLKYLSKVKENIRYELYHCFLFKIKELEYTYDVLQLNVANEFIRCDFSNLKTQVTSLCYNFIFVSQENGLCELRFYPEKPLWDESKVCPENNINRIVDYISHLKATKYENIPLKEE